MSSTALREEIGFQMNRVITREAMQECEYDFPYHHITNVRDGKFQLTRIMDWGTWGCAYTAYIRFVASIVQRLGCKSALDVGCGDGRLIKELESRGVPELLGIDVSERALRFARAFTNTSRFICGDVTGDVLGGQKFDAVTLIEVLEHLPPTELPRFIECVSRHLQASGRLIVTVPSTNQEVHEKHYQHFTAEHLTSVLSPTFEVLEIRFLNSANLVNALLRRILANRFFVLNSPWLLSLAYRFYETYCLNATEQNGARLFAVCALRPVIGSQ